MSRKDELESILLKPEGKLTRAAMTTQQWAALAGEYIGLRTGTGGQVHGRFFSIPQDTQKQPGGRFFDIPQGDDNGR